MLHEDNKRERVRVQREPKEPERTRKPHIIRYWKRIERYTYTNDGHIEEVQFTSKIQRWTIASANCYYRNMICDGCVHREFCHKANYPMRSIVRRLVQEIGADKILTTLKETELVHLDKENFGVILE